MGYPQRMVEAHERPEPTHTDEIYEHVEVVKKKGRRKKGEPITYLITQVPWEDINDSELITLCMYTYGTTIKRDTEMWLVVHRGVARDDLIAMIRGDLLPQELDIDPIHRKRQKIALFIYENWRYIWSQISCNTCCWECPDAKVLECFLENEKDMLGGDTWKKR